MYSDVLKALSGARTYKEHITKLQSILDKNPTDPQLESAIRAALPDLMSYQAQAISKKLSAQKLCLDKSPSSLINRLYAYCQKQAVTGEPEWMVAARRAGWTPPIPKP